VIICICNAISDRHIRNAIEQGASELEHLQQSLGVATRCGRCREHACALLANAAECAVGGMAYTCARASDSRTLAEPALA